LLTYYITILPAASLNIFLKPPGPPTMVIKMALVINVEKNITPTPKTTTEKLLHNLDILEKYVTLFANFPLELCRFTVYHYVMVEYFLNEVSKQKLYLNMDSIRNHSSSNYYKLYHYYIHADDIHSKTHTLHLNISEFL